MKTKYIISALVLGATTCILSAQDGNPPRDGQRPPPREEGANEPGTIRGEDRRQAEEPLTDTQKAQVKTILAKYTASTLTSNQAKAIHESFRQAGLRCGPAMNDTLKECGFDPEQLRELAPPPDRSQQHDARPPKPNNEHNPEAAPPQG